MSKILIAYATREGHTACIAEHIARRLRETNHRVTLIDVGDVDPFEDGAAQHDGAILAASIHAGFHEQEMIAFVKKHLDALSSMPTAFLSVSLAETTAEDPATTEAKRGKARRSVRTMVDHFIQQTQWRPTRVKPVAGALAYTKHGLILRFFMKRIARDAGASTDTSRDHVFTSWDDVDGFVDDTVASLFSRQRAQLEVRPALLHHGA